ncbi:MAG: hypothetical protein IJO72_04595 [Oscillospiraceae bacterium]|nr:hypothetical protein [Oscillospiraceae bacterium]
MKHKLRTGIFAAIGLFVLILDTKTALLGASRGLELCIRTVIPSLLPFFVLSMLLTSALMGENIAVLKPLGRLCGVQNGTESLLLVGMLGGYPTGAQCVTLAYRDGVIRRQSAERMIAFCNLAGPSFLFGIVGAKFSNGYAPWALWGIHIVSAILVSTVLPGRSKGDAVLRPGKPLTLARSLQRSLRILGNICGWIVLFRIVITFLDRWALWLLPVHWQVAVTGLLELSNGCCDLHRIADEGLRFIIGAAILSFGGLCVTMQTVSFTEGLSIKPYLIGKLLQALLSILLAAMLQASKIQFSAVFWISVPLLIAIIVKFLRKTQNRGSISRLVGV